MSAEKTKKTDFKKYVFWFWILFAGPVFSLFLFILCIRMFADLPDTEALQNPKTNLATEVFSSDMKVLGKFYAENRTIVKFDQISPNVVNALIATEDVRFFNHSGVDVRALLRAVYGAVTGNSASGGGSTLTQQLAKMLFPREDLSKAGLVLRKFKEWIIAVKLEREYTKQEIIAMYLNKFDYVNNAVGIKSAAQIYFGTTPDSLSMEQAATLVGMAKNPAYFNPNRFHDRSEGRRNTVLQQMEKYGFLTKVQSDSLQKIPLKLKFQPENHNEGLAPYFREYLRDVFLKKWCEENPKPDGTKYNVYRDGLKIYTTIDSRMQRYAEEAVTEHLRELQASFDKELKNKRNAPFAWNVNKEEIKSIMHQGMKRSERYRVLKKGGMSEAAIEKNFNTKTEMTLFTWKGAIDTMMTPMDSIRYYKRFLQTGFMSMEPQTGYIKAWVGGISHKYFQYDHVQIGHSRQVGSTFKPFVYALAIQEGYSPCYRVPNVRTCIDMPPGQPQYCPDNAGGEEKLDGKMLTLQQALAHSVNYVSAYLIKQFGANAVAELAHRMGVVSKIDPTPSICLGTPEISVFEMVGANSTFANKGTWIEPTFVTRIEDKNGKVLADFVPRTEEVMNEEKSYVMLQLMKGVVQMGTGSRLRYRYKLNMPIAGKTGTTQNNSDGWFMGITPDLVSGCWVGGEDRAVHFDRTDQGQGAQMALPIWAKYMQKVYTDKTIKISQSDFEKPAKRIEIEMDCSKYNKELESGIENFEMDDF
ncbi:MAG: penicillin-binding protein [Bacteroidetes bacterium RIFCSPLOWO2_12_FULL_35_15]|nr:MAG: penicillin-binding protein [Bacteroidetes bacterium RIFCSPLOWO2_12_FULL_35_15]